MKTYNKYYKKYHLLPLYENHIFKLLNESGHIFHPDENSDYRKAISLIAKDISDVFIDEDTDIIVDNVFTDEPYDYYICNYNSNIFGNFNLLKNLRIFITVNEQQSSGICLLGSDKDLPYLKNKYKPFYKDNSHYIELATIRIVLNENIPLYDLKYEIEEILSHELIHVLDEFYRKYNKRTDKINGKIGKIENLFNIQLNDSDSFMAHKSWNNQDLARFIISCLYYTLITELNAHMENILADIKNHQNIKYNNDIDRYLRQISPTYNAIFKLNFILDKLIINEQMFITDDLSEDVTQIENILYNGDKQYTLSRKFKYWYKLMNRFLKRIKDVAELFYIK